MPQPPVDSTTGFYTTPPLLTTSVLWQPASAANVFAALSQLKFNELAVALQHSPRSGPAESDKVGMTALSLQLPIATPTTLLPLGSGTHKNSSSKQLLIAGGC